SSVLGLMPAAPGEARELGGDSARLVHAQEQQGSAVDDKAGRSCQGNDDGCAGPVPGQEGRQGCGGSGGCCSTGQSGDSHPAQGADRGLPVSGIGSPPRGGWGSELP